MAEASTSNTTKPNIVVIGGGYAGLKITSSLDKSLYKTHQIVMIERKSHFWHSVGGLRTMAEENWEQKLFIPYDNAFKNGTKVIHATVTTIHKNEVIVSTETEWGTHIPFEYLIIATGSNYPKPAKVDSATKEEAIPDIQAQREAVKQASKILIIGGGPIGVELAGELASTYKDKEITIIHSEDNLLNPSLPRKLRDTLKKQLEGLNVKLRLGEKIVFPAGGLGLGLTPRTLTTEAGLAIESDIQFYAAGATPNTGVVATLDESLLESDTRLVKVTPSLQLDHEEYKHIFAIGDITNFKETKLAMRAGAHADVLIKNIEIITSGNKKQLVEYKPGPPAMFVTVGKGGGGGLLPMFGGMVIGEFMVKKLKGKNLFVDRYWKIVTGGPPPS